jgi:hypothetical protein
MEGWERVTFTGVQPDGERLELSFLGQTPSDQVEVTAVLNPTHPNPKGEYLVQTPGKSDAKVAFPQTESWVRGYHGYVPGDWARRRPDTPGLVDTHSYYDEQLLVRVAPLCLGAAMMSDPSWPRDDITVPAGDFAGAVVFSVTAQYFKSKLPLLLEFIAPEPTHYPYGPVKIWIHPAVPGTHMVKMEFPDGASLQLLDFGPHL